LDESKKADKPTLNLFQVVFTAWMRTDSARPIPELFSPDESKRAERKLELTLFQACSGLDESKKADKPILDLSRVAFIARMRATELKRSLILPYPKPFQAWMRVRRLTSHTQPIPSCFHSMDESR
jgi:hypothetical protein